jgi:hypothetical protein
MEKLTKNVLTGIRCQDIQTGLHGYTVNEFETLLKTGMAARLAVHIRGGDAIPYQKLKEYSALLFDINKLVFDPVLRVLQDISFIRVIGAGTSKTVVPTVPYFNDMYETLGSAANNEGLNEIEQMSIHIVNNVAECPRRKEKIVSSLGIDSPTMEGILRIGKEGSYLNEVHVEGEPLLFSPLYFAEKPEDFARVVKQYGETSVAKVLKLLRLTPGWPLSKLMQTQEIGGTRLNADEFEIARIIIHKGLVQPPEITTSYSGTNEFLFTPPLGTNRILVVEKEIYEKAMACISCVRQGEHFGQWNIKWPRAIINALLNHGELKPTTIAKEQYKPMCIRGIVKLQNVRNNWWKPVLVDTPENKRALSLALEMLGGGEVLTERGYDSDSVRAIYSDSDYTEAIRGYGNIIRRKKIPKPRGEYDAEIDRLLFEVQKGT